MAAILLGGSGAVNGCIACTLTTIEYESGAHQLWLVVQIMGE